MIFLAWHPFGLGKIVDLDVSGILDLIFSGVVVMFRWHVCDGIGFFLIDCRIVSLAHIWEKKKIQRKERECMWQLGGIGKNVGRMNWT